jgi:predicted Zn-dependent protease with MMP-like domain
MPWSATIAGFRDNPVPNDSVYMTVRYVNGDKVFDKEYKLVASNFASQDAIEAFVAEQVDRIDTLYAATLDLPEVEFGSVPNRVTMFQARAALMQVPASPTQTLFDLVDAHCKAAGGVVFQAWEYANHCYRYGALVTSLAPTFGITDEQMDEIFRQAILIEA